MNEEAGRKLAAETPGLAQFCGCDVTSWTDQLQMFKEAVAQSPNRGVDIVVANGTVPLLLVRSLLQLIIRPPPAAGISVADSVYKAS